MRESGGGVIAEEALLGGGGCRGRHLLFLLVISLPASIPQVFLLFSHVFITATPTHYCRVPYNTTGLTDDEITKAFIPVWADGRGGKDRFSKCQMYQFEEVEHFMNATIGVNGERKRVDCPDGWVYDKTHYEETLVTKLDLVCKNRWLLSMSTTLFYLGSLIGNMIFGWASDRYGRKGVFFPMLLTEGILSLATALSPPHLATYTVLRTIRSLFFPSMFQIPLVLFMEMVSVKWRGTIVMLMCCMTAVASALLALINHLTRNYYRLSLAVSIPVLVLAGLCWWIPESPRWLLSRGRTSEALQVLRFIAVINQEKIPEHSILQVDNGNANAEADKMPSSRKVGLLEIFKDKVLLLRLNVLVFSYCGCSMAYNALAYFAPQHLNINPNLAFSIIKYSMHTDGIIEIPGYLLGWWVMDKLGRRSTLTICMLLGGLASLATTILSADIVMSHVMLALLVKLLCGCGYAVLYVYLGELTPTNVRSTATALVTLISGSSLLIIPYLIQLDNDDSENSGGVSLSVMGWLWLLSGATCWLILPETLHQNLSETISQVSSKHRRHNQKGPNDEADARRSATSNLVLLFNWIRCNNGNKGQNHTTKNYLEEAANGVKQNVLTNLL